MITISSYDRIQFENFIKEIVDLKRRISGFQDRLVKDYCRCGFEPFSSEKCKKCEVYKMINKLDEVWGEV